jgi:hypothetical protein
LIHYSTNGEETENFIFVKSTMFDFDIVVDTLPAGTTFVSASAGCVEAAGVVTCDLGDMTAGTFAAVTIEATAPDVFGSITNMAEVTTNSFDADMTNNTISEDTMVGFFTFLPVVFGSD